MREKTANAHRRSPTVDVFIVSAVMDPPIDDDDSRDDNGDGRWGEFCNVSCDDIRCGVGKLIPVKEYFGAVRLTSVLT